MQSTGQTSTQALSLTSMHGSAITYTMVISPLPLRLSLQASMTRFLEFARRPRASRLRAAASKSGKQDTRLAAQVSAGPVRAGAERVGAAARAAHDARAGRRPAAGDPQRAGAAWRLSPHPRVPAGGHTHTARIVFKQPTPFWPLYFCGYDMIV